ncbi:hypothetical protein HMPREF9430_01845 [Solobacterium moorei F0204]|uniref:Uncharacterized protein n=1 Tax=Solobacterium moorei F0204 TaxID=706433 RepID=E7MQK9_9FIRM|nr:hypothetical protein HMPREF9430_01845 [Solobacterium moorei F0204]
MEDENDAEMLELTPKTILAMRKKEKQKFILFKQTLTKALF